MRNESRSCCQYHEIQGSKPYDSTSSKWQNIYSLSLLELKIVCCVDQVLVPPLRELEVYIFERLFRYLWQKALLESVKREPSGGPMFSPHMMTPTHKASQHEDAIQRWLDALQVCCPLTACSKQ